MTQAKSPKKENILVNILINILIPTLILTKFSGEEHLGTKWAVVIALSFPLFYGLREFMISRKFNVISIIGVVSIMLTGGMTLMKLPPEYIAIKEAAIPGLLAIITLVSLKTRYPLVKTFLYNDNIMQTQKVASALKEYGNESAFERALTNASYLLALSFVVSSILNYVLAKIILVSPPGTEAFNAELGKMNALSFPVIAVPAMIITVFALFYLFKRIKILTHLDLEDILIQH